ncbi:MAG TPA: biosynthetic peptidoglycan transglycosylase [Sphingobacteriaceae bacterium]
MNNVLLRLKNIPNRYIKTGGIILLSLLVLVFATGVIAYTKRGALLEKAINKAVNKAKRDYNLNVKIKNAHFTGLSAISFDEITVVPENRDSLALLRNLVVDVKLFPLVFGDVKLAGVSMNNSRITLVKKDSLSNYDFLFRKKGADTTTRKRVDLSVLARNLVDQILYKIPDNMDIRDFEISLVDDTNKVSLYTSKADIKNGALKSTIKVNNTESQWHVDGEVDSEDQQFDVKLYAEGKKVELPYLEKRFGLKLNFDTVRTQLKEVNHGNHKLKIAGLFAVRNLLINHPKIASNNIIIPDGSIDGDVIIGENYVAIDSSSVVHLKKIRANPYLKYTLYPKKIYELKLHTDEVNAQELFDAFPQGLFESLEGMQVAGKLQYDFSLFFNTSKPDSVKLQSQLNHKRFKVLKWGKNNLQKINNSFVYTPYEYGKPARNIVVGPQNPNFVPLNQISPYLKNAVLTAEDPSFFRHKGFVLESFRKSIATNYKEKSFKRGGSTISMQLVKNVFLNRQKNIARKVEEILIVWIIENTGVSSKSRMFEVYLNLIEWGRNIYGIGEAASHYFGKHPSQLDLGESIFLASVVPRPKSAMYFFEPDGSLRTSLRGYFRLIGGLMARRGWAQPDSNVYGFYAVRLKESLRTYVVSIDSASTDSLFLEEEQQLEDSDNFLQKIFRRTKPDSAKTKAPVNKPRNGLPADTVKTPAELRRERREQRRMERELKNAN